jgi:hypothetical protein
VTCRDLSVASASKPGSHVLGMSVRGSSSIRGSPPRRGRGWLRRSRNLGRGRRAQGLRLYRPRTPDGCQRVPRSTLPRVAWKLRHSQTAKFYTPLGLSDLLHRLRPPSFKLSSSLSFAANGSPLIMPPSGPRTHGSKSSLIFDILIRPCKQQLQPLAPPDWDKSTRMRYSRKRV